MLDRLTQALSQAARQRKTVGLLLIDLDDFKRVNDDLGHSVGDTVLQRVASRLLSCIRGCDTACRYGGDEFVILLPEIEGAGEVESVRQKILAHLSTADAAMYRTKRSPGRALRSRALPRPGIAKRIAGARI